jgi:hypothetical protein
MPRKSVQSEKENEPKSEALKTFETSLDGVTSFIKSTPSLKNNKKILSYTRGLQKWIKERHGKMPNIARVSQIPGEINAYAKMLHFRSEWVGVMLITFLTAYLEDALIILADKNSNLLKDFTAIDAKRIFECENINELRFEIKEMWAESVLRGLGPEGWSKRFNKMGVKGYNLSHIATLQHLFDTRNCIIHTNGMARQPYLKKYPGQRLENGRIQISLPQVALWTEAMSHFVRTTDAFLLNYPQHNNEGSGQDGA